MLVLGGSDDRDAGGKLTSIEMFDPATGAFRAAGDLIEARYKMGGAAVLLPANRVLLAGGGLRSEVYDVRTGRSVPAGPVFGQRLNFASATLLFDGSVLVAGGYDEDGIRMSGRAWRFFPKTISD